MNMLGYKATDKDMRCKGHQFELGVWYEIPAEVKLEICKSGWHFCEFPSGIWEYYTDPTTRVFECEAEGVEDQAKSPGASHKLVARRLRLVKEITPGSSGNSNTGNSNTGDSNTGDSNTGDRNTGDRNTGNSNTGNSNTGDSNTGYSNTGDSNTGYSNTGDSNTGDSNTGYSNTGDSNTGNSNTGNSNTGDSNTGYRNTGDRNTGNGNAADYCNGYFCANPPKFMSFGVQVSMSRDRYLSAYPIADLCEALAGDAEIKFARFKTIPGITKRKLAALHAKHIAGRKARHA